MGVINRAFLTEDKPIIEAAQRNIDMIGATLTNFTEGDAGSAMVRRDLDKLARKELGGGKRNLGAAPAFPA